MPRRPARPQGRPMRAIETRTATVRQNANLSGISLRRGDDVLGTIGRIGDDTAEWLAGTFAHTPAFSEQAPLFAGLEAAKAAGDTAKAEQIAADIEKLDIHVHHGGHDMRIDDPGTVSLAKGQVRFRASPAFQTLRNGGL